MIIELKIKDTLHIVSISKDGIRKDELADLCYLCGGDGGCEDHQDKYCRPYDLQIKKGSL